MNFKRGISVIEIVLVVGILLLIFGVSVSALPGFNSRQALDQDVSKIKNTLTEARILTTSSKNDSQYGVKVFEDHIILFVAPFSSSNISNITTDLSSKVHITSISLDSGGDEIVFNRLIGGTDNFGTIQVALRSDPSASSTIEIFKAGLIEKR